MPIGVNQNPPGSQAQFNQYISQVNEIAVQIVPQGSPNIGTLFGYDSDNTIDIDNIKVVQLVPGLAPISVVKTNNQVKVYLGGSTHRRLCRTPKLNQCSRPLSQCAWRDFRRGISLRRSGWASMQQFFRTICVP